MSEHKFSHISADGDPSMVDVGSKIETERIEGMPKEHLSLAIGSNYLDYIRATDSVAYNKFVRESGWVLDFSRGRTSFYKKDWIW